MSRNWISIPVAIVAMTILGGCGCSETGSETLGETTEDSGTKLYTNNYIVPPSFLTSAPVQNGGVSASDPFVPSNPDDPLAEHKDPPKRMTAREVLEEYGVTFPPGAIVSSGGSSVLIVRNTEENLNLVEEVIRSMIADANQFLRFRIDLFEADDKLLHDLVVRHEEEGDHTIAFDELMVLSQQGKAEFISSLLVEVGSGQRAHVVSGGTEISYITGFRKQDGEWMPSSESREVGTIFEVDPVLGPDDATIDLSFSLEHHFAPPKIRKHIRKTSDGDSLEYDLTEFYYARISTQLVLTAGETRILGLLNPSAPIEGGMRDRIQIAFLHSDLVPNGADAEAVFSEKRDLPPRP